MREIYKFLTFCPVLVFLSCKVLAVDLMEIYTLAETRDPLYQQAVLSTLASRESKPQARALLFPSVSLTANTIDNDETISSADVGSSGDIDFNGHGYTFSVTQPLFRWDRYLSLRQANSTILQAEAEQLSAQQALIIRVAESYFGILFAEDSLKFATSEKESLNRQLEQATQRFKVAFASITDVQETQAGFDNAIADKIQAENSLDDALEELREITSEYTVELASLMESMPIVSPVPNDINQWLETSKSQNLSVVVAKHSLENSRQEIKKQNAGHLPTLDLVASHGYDVSGGRFGETDTGATSIGLELNLFLFQGGLVNSKSKEARIRYEQSLQEFKQALNAAEKATRQSFSDINSGLKNVAALKRVVISREAALIATEIGFKNGTRTTVDVLASKQTLSGAKRKYSRARYDYLLDSLRLKQAVGTLKPDDLIQINDWLN